MTRSRDQSRRALLTPRSHSRDHGLVRVMWNAKCRASQSLNDEVLNVSARSQAPLYDLPERPTNISA
jgi:hypothetical protein